MPTWTVTSIVRGCGDGLCFEQFQPGLNVGDRHEIPVVRQQGQFMLDRQGGSVEMGLVSGKYHRQAGEVGLEFAQGHRRTGTLHDQGCDADCFFPQQVAQ